MLPPSVTGLTTRISRAYHPISRVAHSNSHVHLVLPSGASRFLHSNTTPTGTSAATKPSFAELFRRSVDSVPVLPGDVLQGHVVGAFRPESSSSRFYVVDFGLKEEATLTPAELNTSDKAQQKSMIGDGVSMSLVDIEDDFNEPVFDHDRQAQMSTLQAERYELLTRALQRKEEGDDEDDVELGPRMVYGRFSRFNRGGLSVKVLGVDAFIPRHHVLALERPIIGTFLPFYILSVSADTHQRGGGGGGGGQQQQKSGGGVTRGGGGSGGRIQGNDTKHLDVYPVVSSYGAVLLCLANLVGFDDAWKATGGGTAKERLAYLRLLTRVLTQKNPGVRKLFPSHMGNHGHGGNHHHHYTRNRRTMVDGGMEGGGRNRHHYEQRDQFSRKRNNNMHFGAINEENGVYNDDDDQNVFRKQGRNDNNNRGGGGRDNEGSDDGTEWLNELPTGSWASSGKSKHSSTINTAKPPIHSILRKRPGHQGGSGSGGRK